MNPKPSIGLKLFRAECCHSYLLMDRSERLGIMIDPVLELMEEYREFIAGHGLKISHVLDTHTHADHFSASAQIRDECGATVGMSRLTRSARPLLRLKHGDQVQASSLRVQVLETPGHTPDALSFHWFSPEGKSLAVFTGDTLFIGSSGRTDFPGASPEEQYRSLHEVLGKLPDETLVCPGHDYNQRLFSTIGVEKARNPHYLIPSSSAFVELKNAESICSDSEEIRKRIDFNMTATPESGILKGTGGSATACGVASSSGERIAEISVEKYQAKLQAGSPSMFYIDVREEDEFAEGHIPGTRNIPLSELGLHLSELQGASRIYLSCQSGRRSATAAKTLQYLGFGDVVNVSGGFGAWLHSGLKVEK